MLFGKGRGGLLQASEPVSQQSPCGGRRADHALHPLSNRADGKFISYASKDKVKITTVSDITQTKSKSGTSEVYKLTLR